MLQQRQQAPVKLFLLLDRTAVRKAAVEVIALTARLEQAAEKSVDRLATTTGAKAPTHLTRLTRS